MYSYQELIRIYSKSVADGTSDTDLSPKERRLTSVLLNLASNHGMASVAYPPTDKTRDDVVRELGKILWDARPLVEAAAPMLGDSFDKAITRAIESLRNI
jgi:hypothetical protein